MIKKLFNILLLLFIFSPIFSQSNRFVQKLEWDPVVNAYEYKVEIELLEEIKSDKEINTSENNSTESVFDNIEKQKNTKTTFISTQNNYIEISYTPGLYRYRVYTYDFLGRESNVSDWQNFEIIKALDPKVNLIESVDVEKKSKKEIKIPIDSENITWESEIVLIDQNTQKEIKGKISEDPESPEKKYVVFPPVKESEYKIKITNPGGLSTITDTVELNFYQNPYHYINLEFQIGIGNFISYGESVFAKWNNSSLIVPAFAFNIKYLPFDFGNNNLGFSINSTYFKTEYKKNIVKVELPTESIELNIVYQFNFMDSLLGISLFTGANCNFTWAYIDVEDSNTQTFCLNFLGMQAGVTFIYAPKKHLTLEAGAKGTIFFNQSDISFNLTPLFNLGLKF